MDHVPKINTKGGMRWCELPYVTAKGGGRLRATLVSKSSDVTKKKHALGIQKQVRRRKWRSYNINKSVKFF